ncbi:MAG: hypothetical protein JW971_01765 [Synergistales bacterium]|nr:hypothetical protein [Synergistales bacterium]
MKFYSSLQDKGIRGSGFPGLFLKTGSLKALGILVVTGLTALLLGWSATSVLNAYLADINFQRKADASITRAKTTQEALKGEKISSSWKDFLAGNPFNLSVPDRQEGSVVEDAPRDIAFDIKGAQLVATFPGIALGLRENDRLLVLLEGQEYQGYKVISIESEGAVFQKDGQDYILPLLYSGSGSGNGSSSGNSGSVRNSPGPVEISRGEVLPPSDSEPGAISQELVNQLLLNPFDEMKKIRLRAKFDGEDALGIQVQWIAKDSILGELGVEKGDVIRSINGIPMRNMGDISNAINSLMGGSRFDVEVLRDGESRELTYVVR